MAAITPPGAFHRAHGALLRIHRPPRRSGPWPRSRRPAHPIARMARSYTPMGCFPISRLNVRCQTRSMRSPGQSQLRKNRRSLPDHVYHVTATTMARMPAFTGSAAFAAARSFHEVPACSDARLIAWVLMPDHAHWLVQLGANAGLDDVVTRLKSGSARRANEVRGLRGRVWAPGYYEHCLRSESELLDTARYICANPVRAGITASVRDYPFWNTIYL